MRWLAPVFVLACVLAGCGGGTTAPGAAAPDAVSAYKQILAAWKRGDAESACAAMTPAYQHKLEAELEIFDADCPRLVSEIRKQVTGPDAIKQLSTKAVDGPGGARSVLVRTRLKDGAVRTRFDFAQRGDRWVIAGDRSLDATGPQGPVVAYRTSAKKRGADPEVLWSVVAGRSARIWVIDGNGSGSFTLTRIEMSRAGESWRVSRKVNVGTAPDTVHGKGSAV